jgi:hypothetical protein
MRTETLHTGTLDALYHERGSGLVTLAISGRIHHADAGPFFRAATQMGLCLGGRLSYTLDTDLNLVTTILPAQEVN